MNIDQTTVTDPDVPGLSYIVRIVEDPDGTPLDADCYSETDIQAWRDGQWRYVGVIVTPVLADVEINRADASLWAVEYGSGGEGSFDISTEHIVHISPVPELITEARAQLAAFAPMLAEASAVLVRLTAEETP